MSETSGDRERRVDAAIAWYYQQAEAGAPPDPNEFLARFPDVRTDLESFLADKQAFDRAIGPADPNVTVTLDSNNPAPPAPLGRVRYFGDFELLEEIARGGMGVVYKARQVSLNRTVALKMILSGQLAGPDDIRRFQQEAEAAANLDHPNILPIYEVGEHDGRQYFSMKLVEGGSLTQRLQSPRPSGRGVSADVQLLTTLARAVHYAHQRGILHRDLKPSNILLDPDGTPYVADFGLAKKVEGEAGLTQSGALVGSPSYMAPEQARAERQLSTGVDVYSLGAILYEVLTGRPPFRGASIMDTVLQALNREPDDPRAINLNVNRDLAVIALKCLSKEPGKRYESAAALADDLDRWQRGEPILARPVSSRERLVKWVRRNPVPAAFTAAILLLLIGGLTAVTRLYLRSEHFRQDAESERDQARVRLARQYVEKSGTAADQGNPLLGLPWLVEALKTVDGKPEADLHRLHLGTLLARAPGLVHYEPMATCVAVHPDGKRIAIGQKDGVELLAIGGDQPLVPILKTSGPARAVVFSPDGKKLLVGTGTENWMLTSNWKLAAVRVFDADTGAPVSPEARLGRATEGATSVRFSADGSVVVALWEGHVNRHVAHTEVYLYDPATLAPIGKPLVGVHPELMKGHYVKIDYQGLRALTPCVRPDAGKEEFAGRLQVWDLRTGKPLFDPIKPTTNEWDTGTVLAPGGGRFAMVEGEKHVRLYDAGTGKPVAGPLAHEEPVFRMAYRPDGKVLATLTTDGRLRTWDTGTGAEVGPDAMHIDGDFWWDLEYTPDGRTIWTHGPKGTAAYDPDTGSALLTAEYKDAPSGVVFSPDGVHVAASGYEGVRLWRRAGGQVGPFLPHGSSVGVSFSPDGRFLVTSGNGVRVWDLVATRSESSPLVPLDAVPAARSWSLTTAGDRAVRLDADGRVRMFDTRTGEPVGPELRPPGEWRSAELSPDGKLIVTVGWAEGRSTAPTAAELAGRMCGESGHYVWKEPRDVGVWDAATGRAVITPLRHRTVGKVFVSPDGKSLLVTGRVWDYTGQKPGGDGKTFTELSRWDLETGELRAPVVRQPGHLTAVGTTPDGRKVLLLVPADKGDAAQFWDVETLMPDGAPFGPPGGDVDQATISPDGKRVLTVSADGEAQVWDAGTGQAVAGPLRHTSPRVGQTPTLSAAVFSPDGRRVATVTGSNFQSPGEARVWDVETGRPVTPILRSSSYMRFMTFSPDGRLLAAVGTAPHGFEARMWEADTGMPVTAPLPVAAGRQRDRRTRDLDDPPRFTADGRRLVIPTPDGPQIINLVRDAQPAADLEPLAKILAGHEVDTAGGFQPLSEAAALEARDRWRTLNPAPRVKPVPTHREELARTAVAEKAWHAADRHLSEVVRERPEAAWAWAAQANVREQLGRLDAAKADWDEVIHRADGRTIRGRRGSVLARLGKFTDAAADYAAAWTATGSAATGARLALTQWAAGDRAGYRRTCEQLRDRRDEFVRDEEGLALAALACGLDPTGADLVQPFVPLLEPLVTAGVADADLLRPLALAYVRTGTAEKAVPPLVKLNAGHDSYSRDWQVLVLALPRTSGPIGLWRAALMQIIDNWYAREAAGLDWTERVIVPELRKQGD